MLTENSTKMKQKDFILEVEDLSVIRSGKLVISDINFWLSKGEFVGIVGQTEVERLLFFFLY